MRLRSATILALCVSLIGHVTPIAAQSQRGAVAFQSDQDRKSFEVFWPRFREALLQGNYEVVTSMTQIPLEVRGELDTDAIRSAEPSELRSVLMRALASDSGLSLRGRLTNRSLVERVTSPLQPAPGVAVTPQSARIGAFGFEHHATGWRLQRVFLSAD